LDDPSAVVRQAVAVGLKKLARPSSLDCMQRHLAKETNDGVKAQLQHAIDAVNGGGAGPTPAPPAVGNAKYYVSISAVTNNTARAAGDVERIVHGAIAGKLAQLGEYQLAPSGESNTD